MTKRAAIRVIGRTISDANAPGKGIAKGDALQRASKRIMLERTDVQLRNPMSVKQPRLSFYGARKNDVRTQFAALCYRIRRGKVQILVITSRGTKRWIMPKGWPMEGKTPAACAAQEAWEEAGVIGQSGETCLGVYTYAKEIGEEDILSCLAMLYPLHVTSLAEKYPEAGQRRRRWVSRKKAAKMVAEPELGRLIRDFDPRGKRRSA
ncbi:MAG: NUDIX hydrolase [Sulfitobacter sp.]